MQCRRGLHALPKTKFDLFLIACLVIVQRLCLFDLMIHDGRGKRWSMMLELSAENYISKQCADASHSLGIYIYNNVLIISESVFCSQ